MRQARVVGPEEVVEEPVLGLPGGELGDRVGEVAGLLAVDVEQERRVGGGAGKRRQLDDLLGPTLGIRPEVVGGREPLAEALDDAAVSVRIQPEGFGEANIDLFHLLA